jgi:hypothetical protein
MSRSAGIAIQRALSSLPPNTNSSAVAPLVAHAGHMFGTIAQATITRPSGFHSRWKPVTAVSPVASV